MKTKLFMIVAVMWIGLGTAMVASAQWNVKVDPQSPRADSTITVKRVLYEFIRVRLPLYVADTVRDVRVNLLNERAAVVRHIAPRIPGRTIATEEILFVQGDTLRYNPLHNFIKIREGRVDTTGGQYLEIFDTVVVIPAAMSFDSLKDR
jgi:hypothetical protein